MSIVDEDGSGSVQRGRSDRATARRGENGSAAKPVPTDAELPLAAVTSDTASPGGRASAGSTSETAAATATRAAAKAERDAAARAEKEAAAAVAKAQREAAAAAAKAEREAAAAEKAERDAAAKAERDTAARAEKEAAAAAKAEREAAARAEREAAAAAAKAEKEAAAAAKAERDAAAKAERAAEAAKQKAEREAAAAAAKAEKEAAAAAKAERDAAAKAERAAEAAAQKAERAAASAAARKGRADAKVAARSERRAAKAAAKTAAANERAAAKADRKAAKEAAKAERAAAKAARRPKRVRDLRPNPFPVITAVDWERPAEAATVLFKRAEYTATESIDWYLRHKRSRKRASRLLRALSILLVAAGMLVPVLAGAFPVLHAEYGFGLLGLAAACVAFDHFFGLSSGWMRDMVTAQALHHRLEALRFDWAAECARSALTTRRPMDEVDRQLTLLRGFSEDVVGLTSSETAEWMAEFQSNLAHVQRRAGATASRAAAARRAAANGADAQR